MELYKTVLFLVCLSTACSFSRTMVDPTDSLVLLEAESEPDPSATEAPTSNGSQNTQNGMIITGLSLFYLAVNNFSEASRSCTAAATASDDRCSLLRVDAYVGVATLAAGLLLAAYGTLERTRQSGRIIHV